MVPEGKFGFKIADEYSGTDAGNCELLCWNGLT
jgi:hypothetical protein